MKETFDPAQLILNKIKKAAIERKNKLESSKGLLTGIIYGLVFGLLANVYIVLLYQLFIKDTSECFKVLLFLSITVVLIILGVKLIFEGIEYDKKIAKTDKTIATINNRKLKKYLGRIKRKTEKRK